MITDMISRIIFLAMITASATIILTLSFADIDTLIYAWERLE